MERCTESVKGLILYMSLGEAKIFCEVDERACFSTVVDKDLTVVFRNA